MPLPDHAPKLHADPCIAVVVAGSGHNVPVEEADGLVLGLTLVNSFHARNEKGGRSRDPGFALGPAITTPDELDDAVTVDERGRRYRFGLSLMVNAEEILKIDLSSLPFTLAELLSSASESAALHQGDIVALALGNNDRLLEKGDQVQVVCEKLGTLTTRVG